MNKLIIGAGLGCFAFLLLTGCDWSASQLQSGLETINEQESAGVITPEQAAAMREVLTAALNAGTQFDLGSVVQSAVTLVAGYFGIRLWRGSPNARTGTAPTAPTV